MEEIEDPEQEEYFVGRLRQARTHIMGRVTYEELAQLRQEPGGEILAHGGTQFVRSLIRLGLVDEYRLWVLPAAVGQGAPLFTGLARPVTLHLIKATPFPSGILELCYTSAAHRPAGAGPGQIG